MNLATKAKIKSQLAAKGIYWTDAQIEAYAEQRKEQPQASAVATEKSPYPVEQVDYRSNWEIVGENLWDLPRATLWQALDVGTFGLAGLGFKTVAPKTYKSFTEELSDTMLGRIGGAVGGLAGFMVPMGAVARGTSLAARVARGALQSKKVKAGLEVAKPTTRTLQLQAAKELMKASEKEALRTGGKALTLAEAKKIAIESSDDIIGFTQTGWKNTIFGKGPAYQLEHSMDKVNQVRQNLQKIMPERLAAGLKGHNIVLKESQLLKLSDDVVELIGTQPFNSIETILAGKYTGKVVAPLMNVIGGIAQEAVNFGIVGTAMDGVMYAKGELDYSKQSFAEKTMHHAFIGGMFGGVRFIPGGRGQSIWRDMMTYSGGATKRLNNQIKKMSLDETKAFARMTMKNDKSVLYRMNNRNISIKELRKGSGINEAGLPGLKNAVIKKNNETLNQFKNLGDLGTEVGRDLLASSGRMIAGTIVFNWAALDEGAFYNLHPAEAMFHLGLGAVMTKSGKPLIHGKKARWGLGEKDYYYNSDLRDVRQELDRAYFTGSSIEGIAKQFDGNLFTDWIAENPIKDVDTIIGILKENNVIYSRTEDGFPGLITPNTFNKVALRNRDLLNLIDPIIPAMQARNIEMNPNVKKAELESALKAIRTTESHGLSTGEQKVFLDSKRNIIKSIYEGSSEKWTEIQVSLLDNFGQQIGILTEDPGYLRSDGRMLDYNLNGEGYTKAEQKVLGKLEDTRQAFQDMDIIKLEQISTGKEEGFPIELNSKKIKQIEELQDSWELDLGREFYGESSNMPIDMGDKTMWNVLSSIDYQKNVSRVHDVMMGKEVPGIRAEDGKSIRSLLHESLSHKDNKRSEIIVDSPEKIQLDPEGLSEPEEYYMLNEMLSQLWSISSASGRQPKDTKRVEVSLAKARSLKEKLVQAGMPDPEVHGMGLDSRMQTWVDKAIMHGMDQVLGGLDMSPYKAEAVRRLMMNGVLQHITEPGPQGKSLGLQAPHEITIKQIEAIMPNITKEAAEKIRTAYDNVMNELGTKLVKPREDFELTGLTDVQLSSILTAETLLEPSRIKDLAEKLQEDNALQIIGIREDNEVLRAQISDADPSEVAKIKAMLEHGEAVERELGKVQLSFAKTFGGGIEVSRASANLHFMSTMTDASGKTLHDHLGSLPNTPDPSDFRTITEQIRDLQEAIANKVAERPDVRTWDDKRQEAIARYKQEEVQGRMPEDREYVTPELFFSKHNISVDNVFKKGESGHGLTYDSAGDVVYELYKRKTKEKFAERLFNLAGSDSKNANSKLRNEVMYVSNLFERRFNVKRLSISDGGGVFEKGDISKGYLTDFYSEIFLGEAGDMILLSSEYYNKGRMRNIATDDMALQEITKILDSNTFVGSLQNGGVTNMKYIKDGRATLIEGNKEYWDGHIDLGAQHINGRHYVITVDENINLVVPEAGFNRLAESFVRWFEKDGGILNDPYVKASRKNMEGADNLFKTLEEHYNRLKEIYDTKGEYDANIFRDSGYRNRTEHMEDAIYTIFNSMYGEKIDADWLQAAYFDKSTSYKDYKYRRLAQNQGYSRNSKERQLLLETIHKGTDNKYHADLIKKYTTMEKVHVAIIDDGNVSEKGKDALGIITDNRSVAEARLEAQKGDLSPEDYENMKDILRNSEAINTEAINGMTIVSRELLDYLLLLSGQSEMIGESSGQKPVGLSSYTDANGNMHVFYNKTHYFYDSKLDPWFKKNKDINQIAMTSGAKKHKIIDKNDPKLENKFKPIANIPSIDSGETLYSFINGLKLKAGDSGVMPVNFNETLSGTVYGKPKGVRILKQFDNWTSPKVQTDLYEWARADMLEYLSEVNIHLYNPENIGEASREAQSFIRVEGNKDGTLSTDAPNASTASIWIEGGGIPFSEMSKNLYDALIKRRHIDDAGVFDGFTDAGGAPIVRGNLSMDLNIPVYRNEAGENIQIKLGEAHVGAAYLDRNIHFKGQFGRIEAVPKGVKLRPKHLDKSALTVAFSFSSPEGKRDVIVNIKDGAITDPLNKNAKITDGTYKEISEMVEYLRGKLGQDRGLSTFRDVVNELKGEGKDVFETSKGSVYVVDGFQTTRTKAATTGRGPGLKERSSITIYLTDMQARNLVGPLGILKTIGKMAPRKIALGKLGITVDGKNYGGHYKARKGLRPFEIWTNIDGTMASHHLGNKIAKITTDKFDYKGAQLAIMVSPAPRTGPHDAMVVKVKDMLDKRDGGLIELNTYDVTSRAMRDMDTDKLPFFMDTPYSAMQEAYRQNGVVKEAALLTEGMKNRPDLDIYSNQSNKRYNEKVQLFKRLRGPVVKMHRKLTYAKRLFDSIDGIEIGDGNKIVFNGDMQKAQQRLTDDSQNILDIYDGTSDLLANIETWKEQTMFGNSQKSETDPSNMTADQPFFHIRLKDGTKSTITKETEKAIVRKVLNDYGRLLQLESSIYEAGEAKSPRYSDMVSTYRDFRHEYSGENADWNFYHYIKKSVGEPEADMLFFQGKADRKKDKLIEPIFGGLAKQITEKHLTPFLKSLYGAAEKDFAKVRETYGNSGFDHFNNGILKLLGEQRAEAFEIFSRTGTDAMDAAHYSSKNSLISDLWEQFRGVRTHEEMMVQANTLETELRRSERQYEQESKKPNPDQAYLEMHAENILIRSEALNAMLNKMTLERGEDVKARYGQEIRSHKFDKDKKVERKLNTIKEEYKVVAIRHKDTGDLIKQLGKGEEWTLNKDHVAVYNPVVLKAVVEHELIDGAAYGYSVLGSYSNIAETDLNAFRTIVSKTRREIKKSASDMMKNKGYRDWTKHQSGVQKAIDRGLQSIKDLAMKDAQSQSMLDNTWMGQMPREKETYGEDFLMALLHPDHSGNPNEFHYSPKTGNFMQSLRAPKSSVINAVMTSIERYGIKPNYKEFVQEFAQIHRGFYESIVAGRGVHEGMQRLVDSNFESALLNNTIGKVMNNTFMPKKDYKTMDETFDAMPPILSDYAELYRQILQEGAVADPMTAFGLRRQVIEDQTLGPEAYNRIFQLARGHLVLDGSTAKTFGINKGQGQLLGEILMSRNDVRRRQITGNKRSDKGSEIRDQLNTVTGRENTKKERCPY
jgi:hypothetical protein